MLAALGKSCCSSAFLESLDSFHSDFHEAAHMGLCDGGGAQGGFNWTVFPTELHMKVGLL